MIERYQAIDGPLTAAFPQAAVIYYDRGAIQPDGCDSGWAVADYYPPGSPGQINSCSLYLAEWSLNQETYRRTRLVSDGLPVVPFVALGGGQRRRGASWAEFTPGGPDLETAWAMGLEINHPWAARRERAQKFPVSAAPLVVFWPAAFDPNFPNWGEQFLAYCLGAAAQELPKVITGSHDPTTSSSQLAGSGTGIAALPGEKLSAQMV